HPYDTSADQRVPVRPLAGETVELRVLAAAAVTEVSCEWDDGKQVHVLPLTRVADRPAGPSGAEGHLAAAAAPRRGAGVPWSARSLPVVAGAPVRYRFVARSADRVRRTRWFDVVAAQWSAAGGRLNTTGRSRVVPGSVRWLADGDGVHRVRFALELARHEHLVGFGERFDALDQRGRSLDATVFEQYKGQAAAGRTYLPMPFAHVLGGSGWAFALETAQRTWYDATGAELVVEADLDGRADEELTVAFYDGPVGAVLSQWLDRVGRPEELPDWVFGLWASGNEWNTQQRVLGEIARHRAEQIPVGVVVIEAWSDESTFTAFRDARYAVHVHGAPHRLADFEFPADGAWPDPKGMVDELHEQDVRVLLWQIPLAKMRPPPRGQAAADARALVDLGHAVREQDGARPYRNRGWWFPGGLMPDLTDPAARAWWVGKRRYLVDEVGIDGFKTDGGEHGWGADLRYADGSRGVAGNNRYPVHYAAAYGELLRSCGKAPVTFSRAGFAGSQAHGAFWAGDEDSTWPALRASLTAGLTAAACGIVYWGWDLAGFSGPLPDAELYLRAAGLSTFLPIMQYHSEFNHHRRPSRDRTPWNVAEQTGDPRVLPVFRQFARLRERLRPYLAEQARRTIDTGWPLLRSLVLAHPADERCWAHPYQYLLGDDLLVAPVVAPGQERVPAYLPPGRWVNVWTSALVPGERTVEVPAPLDQVPVWCRQSAWTRLRPVFRAD
ncbi:MAG TPA: TIM-barrel domain-containing protein, partial [Jatrophihabitans sp.]|nr:TIM-barrel domain-containing protein [Jatrophihabitans sp.]